MSTIAVPDWSAHIHNLICLCPVRHFVKEGLKKLVQSWVLNNKSQTGLFRRCNNYVKVAFLEHRSFRNCSSKCYYFLGRVFRPQKTITHTLGHITHTQTFRIMQLAMTQIRLRLQLV